MRGDLTLSRRALLLGAAAILAAGCRPRKHSRATTPDPDAIALIAARDSERDIVASYSALAAADAGSANDTTRAVIAALALHRSHLETLEVRLGAANPGTAPTSGPATPTSGPATPTSGPATPTSGRGTAPTSSLTSGPAAAPSGTPSPAELRNTLAATVPRLTAAATTARAGDAAALLAGIAASHQAPAPSEFTGETWFGGKP